MNQQTEQGVVLEKIPPNLAKVRVPRSAGCEACHNEHCCEPFGDNQMVITAENDPGAETGQQVQVDFVSEGSGKAIAVLYLIPLAAMIIGAILGHNLGFFGRADASAALMGFFFLLLSFLGIYGYNRLKWSRDVRLQPRITRIILFPGTSRSRPAGPQPGAGRISGKSCPHCH